MRFLITLATLLLAAPAALAGAWHNVPWQHILPLQYGRAVVAQEEAARAVMQEASCEAVAGQDERTACRAKARKEPGLCHGINVPSARAKCVEESRK